MSSSELASKSWQKALTVGRTEIPTTQSWSLLWETSPSQSDCTCYKGGSRFHPSGSAMESQPKETGCRKATLFTLVQGNRARWNLEAGRMTEIQVSVFPNSVTDSPCDGENHLILSTPKRAGRIKLQKEQSRKTEMSAKPLPKQNFGVGRQEGKMNSQGSEEGRLLREECFPSAAINNTDVLKSLPRQTIWSPVSLE